MARARLTDRFCAQVRPPSTGRTEYFDTLLAGFSLRVSESGSRTLSLIYRAGAIKRRLTLARYVGPGSLKLARDLARKALMAAAEGRDPASEKTQARRSGDTVAEVIRDYAKHHLSRLKDGEKARRILEKEVVARWRYRRIGGISRRGVIDLVDEVVARGTTGQADRVRGHIHALLNWCLSRDLIDTNPAAKLRRPHQAKIRSRVLGDDELRAIWRAAEKLAYPFGFAVQVLMLTGQRRGEVSGMRWADVDLRERLWVMPDTKSGRPHAVPLAEPAVAILGGLPQIGPYVFGTRDRPISGWSRAKQRLDAAAGIHRGWIIHDLRRTLRTRLPALGIEKHICDRTLGHLPPDISRHYDFYAYLPEKRAALAAWAEELGRIIEGAPAKVVPIR
jgi:integrase